MAHIDFRHKRKFSAEQIDFPVDASGLGLNKARRLGIVDDQPPDKGVIALISGDNPLDIHYRNKIGFIGNRGDIGQLLPNRHAGIDDLVIEVEFMTARFLGHFALTEGRFNAELLDAATHIKVIPGKFHTGKLATVYRSFGKVFIKIADNHGLVRIIDGQAGHVSA